MLQHLNKRRGLSETDARWFFQQEVLAVSYSHRRGVVIRDIKLENTLLDGSARPLVKICDFGLSKSRADGAPATRLGTMSDTGVQALLQLKERR